ncbi:MAG: nickel pincer cofactor biosynthesis protein LarC [Lachnospiraceae bacterium]|nr:nickel pincer cofactor biosynthesis protein LarC [Lachnospiraceae bacterium]
MKTLYLDCSMGAAGDMLAGALLELLPNQADIIRELNELGIPQVSIALERSVKCGIAGSHFKVLIKGVEEESVDTGHEYSHHSHSDGNECHQSRHEHSDHHSSNGHNHSHSSIHYIEHLVKDHLSVPDKVKRDILAVYHLLAEAESKAHDMPIEEIHFHEVGTRDALADIAAVCLLMDRLSPEQVVVSPVHVGSGQVKCTHGILPVPAPATACILKDVPVYGGKIRGELCTPTGAALLKYFATRFGDMPVLKIRSIGYGMGKKDFEAANCVRAMWGETDTPGKDVIWELSCNIDDMTAEEMGFALEEFLAAGALEAYTIPIGMKKSRPGVCLSVLCKEKERESLVQAIFRHTTTLGIREKRIQRYLLERKIKEEASSLGKVHYKEASGYGVSRKKYEYEELAALARQHGMSLKEVRQKLMNLN